MCVCACVVGCVEGMVVGVGLKLKIKTSNVALYSFTFCIASHFDFKTILYSMKQ